VLSNRGRTAQGGGRGALARTVATAQPGGPPPAASGSKARLQGPGAWARGPKLDNRRTVHRAQAAEHTFRPSSRRGLATQIALLKPSNVLLVDRGQETRRKPPTPPARRGRT